MAPSVSLILYNIEGRNLSKKGSCDHCQFAFDPQAMVMVPTGCGRSAPLSVIAFGFGLKQSSHPTFVSWQNRPEHGI